MTSYEEYSKIPAINMSNLKHIKKSPKHFWANVLDPNREVKERTEALRFGTVVHKFILENNTFFDEYVVMPSCDKRTKEGKAIYANTIANNPGKEIITLEGVNILNKMRNALMAKESAKVIFHEKLLIEQTLTWYDSESGVDCKGRLDGMIEPCEEFPFGLIIDLKTAESANYQEFSKATLKYSYYNSAAFYCKGFEAVYKTGNLPPLLYCVIEKDSPYESSFFVADEPFINFGLADNSAMLSLYNRCIANNEWPGYEDSILSLSLPTWVIK